MGRLPFLGSGAAAAFARNSAGCRRECKMSFRLGPVRYGKPATAGDGQPHAETPAVKIDPRAERYSGGEMHLALDALVVRRLTGTDAFVGIEPLQRRGGIVERIHLAVNDVALGRRFDEAGIAPE